jgi:3-ketosteroid 9alpha-monooxygenase subunit B
MPTFEATIREIVQETGDTVTLVLDTPERPPYRAGQFLSIDPNALAATREKAKELEALKGRKERARAYSLASAPHEPHLAITVKEEPAGAFPPLLTPHLVRHAKVGEKLPCTGMNGLYVLPHELPAGAHVVHLCAGSGIVPNFGMLKDALHRGLDATHTVLYSNRTWDDVIFRDQLGDLARAHPERLSVVHFITRGEAPAGAVRSRIDLAAIEKHVPDFERAYFFVCGPSVTMHERRAAKERGEEPAPKFLETMRALVLEKGVPKQRLSTEGW